MRVLFTADLHGLPEAYQGFSETLKAFDIGVIAGDLLDDYISDEELMKKFQLGPDDFLEELPDPDDTIDDRLEAWRSSPQHAHLVRGLEEKEREIKAVMGQANKPVLVVRGNHDCSPLSSEGNFHNIHLKRLDLDGVGFVGYGWLGRELDPERQMDEFGEVEPLIDRKTILVTHCPPSRILDATGRGGLKYSIGSVALAKAIERRRPRFHLFGHCHASAGILGNSVNGAYPRVASFFGIDTMTGKAWIEKDKTRPRPVWVQEAEDRGDAEEMVDVEALERNQMREERRKEMRLHVTWYHDNGKIADGRRFIAIGRHEYYKAFAQALSKSLGTEVYLLDYMIWLDLTNPDQSLSYFMTAAERIDINLQGISKEDLRRATVDASRLALDRRDLGLPYMTSWEINQVYWTRAYLAKTWWHTGGSITRHQAHEALAGKVPLERIVGDVGA